MRRLTFLFAALIPFIPTLNAQAVSIQSVNSKVGEISVNYTLDNPKIPHHIKVNLEYQNQVFTPKTVIGDVGLNVKGPSPKSLVWKIGEDGTEINGSATIKIQANSFSGVKMHSHVLASLLFPGAGQYRLRNKAHYFLHGLGSYAALGGGIYFQHLAQNSYSNYLSSSSIAESNRLYADANQQHWISMAMIGTAAAIWIIDMATVAARTKKINKAWRGQGIDPSLSKYYAKKSTNFIEFAKPSFVDTRSKSSILVDQGKDWFNKGEFETALKHFNEALMHQPNMSQALYWKAETETKILDLNIKAQQYDDYLNQGRQLYEQAELAWQSKTESLNSIHNKITEAKSQFIAAKNLIKSTPALNKHKDGHEFALNKAELLEAQVLNGIQLEAKIGRADSLFTLGMKNSDVFIAKNQVRLALKEYQAALKLDATNPYCSKRISEVKLVLLQFEMKEIERLISEGELKLAEIDLDHLIEIESPSADVQRRLDFIARIKTQLKRLQEEADFKNSISLADNAFKNKEYAVAKKHYSDALQIKPSDSYAQAQLGKVEKLSAQADLFPTTQWTEIELYEGNLIKIIYTGKKGSLDCNNQQGTPFKYKYNIEFLGSQSLSTSSRKSNVKQYLIYTVDYKDCNNVTYACTEFLDLHDVIEQYTNTYFNTDFNYPTEKITSKPYNVFLSDYRIRKCVPK